jgi:double-stranded uracil-DNA glycosylase
MSRLQAFPPVAPAAAHTLILGSMPGAASLAAGEYYAHPRNLFWPLVGALLGFDPQAPYAERVAALSARGYLLWDVLRSCRRAGSLDSAIEADSIEVNDFATLLVQHPQIDRVFFNGHLATTLFRRHVLPTLGPRAPGLALTRLPSNSPAHAGLSAEAKRAAWAAILR